LRTVFIGTTQFAAAVLERLAHSPHRPLLAITRPDRPSGRGRKVSRPPVGEAAQRLQIPLEQPDSVNDPEVAELIAATEPRAVIVCAFGGLIREPLLSEHNMLNIHPSLLPRWRGAAPIERAIMAGDTQTGVSIMRLTAGLDSGPVCLTASESIGPADTYGSLAPRLQERGGQLIVQALDQDPPFAAQDDSEITYAEKIAAEDRLLHCDRPAEELERVVRALHPHIGARARLPDGAILGVQRAVLADTQPHGGELGVFAHEDRLLLGCATGTLELLEVQPPGGRPMDASAYLRGHGAPGRR
jgi:methionyl-tRNA formyltransferase